MEIKKCEKLVCNLYDKKKLCNTHKSPEAVNETQIKTKKIHRVIEFDPRSLVEAVHRYEYGLKSKSQRWFRKRFLQANKQLGSKETLNLWQLTK